MRASICAGEGVSRALPVELPEYSLKSYTFSFRGTHYKLGGISRMYEGVPGRVAVNGTVDIKTLSLLLD